MSRRSDVIIDVAYAFLFITSRKKVRKPCGSYNPGGRKKSDQLNGFFYVSGLRVAPENDAYLVNGTSAGLTAYIYIICCNLSLALFHDYLALFHAKMATSRLVKRHRATSRLVQYIKKALKRGAFCYFCIP